MANPSNFEGLDESLLFSTRAQHSIHVKFMDNPATSSARNLKIKLFEHAPAVEIFSRSN